MKSMDTCIDCVILPIFPKTTQTLAKLDIHDVGARNAGNCHQVASAVRLESGSMVFDDFWTVAGSFT